MNIPVGEYTTDNTPEITVLLLNNFGCIWSKIIRRELITVNDIYYPEYCVYEDNQLIFIYLFFVKSFLKTNMVGYIHQLDFESVTRSKPNLRTLDRLNTSLYGFEKCLRLAKNKVELIAVEKYFIHKYLVITFMLLFSENQIKIGYRHGGL